MTERTEFDSRRRETKAAMLGWMANKAFTHKTSGIDGIVKKLIAKQMPPADFDPELEHDETQGRI